MKIALLTYSSKPRGGVVHTLSLAEALARGGDEVTVWSLGRGGDSTFFRTVDSAVTVRMVPFPERDGEGVGPRILRSIDVLSSAFAESRASYDIVHAQDCITANAVNRAGAQCIRTIHHLDNFTTPELAACHEKAIVSPVARICVSAAVAVEVREGWGYAPVVIPNGVDSGRFERAAADNPEVRRRRATWTDQFGEYAVAVGGIEPRKGSIDVLEAWALLRASYPARRQSRLVFAGGETLFDYRDYRRQFDERAIELAVQPIILGTVDNDDLPYLVAAASALPFFSTKEGFGLAAMEALAAAVPVVARDLPVLHEVFGGTVTYASTHGEMAVQLQAALTNPPDPEDGRALAASLTWDEAARKHREFYLEFRRSA